MPASATSSLLHARLDSSSLHSVGYVAQTSTMEVAFRNGSVYRYFGVPLKVYEDLLSADSKGRYFIAAIRTSFRFQRIE